MCAFSLILFASCINTKNVTYFNNLPDSLRVPLADLQAPQQLVQVNDILSIRLGGENEKTVAYINQFVGGSAVGGMQATVDVSGNIELPKIGKLKVVSLTRDSVQILIQNAYSEYLVNPIVSVSFGNFRFAILGEVRSPGYFSSPNEKLNVLEAIAQAGDMTQFAVKNDIKIIREVNGKREVVSINLNDKSFLSSDNYYLHRYDIIYVEPTKQRYFSDNFSRTTTIIGAVSSLFALIIVILR